MLDDDGQVVSQVLKYQASFLLLRAIFLGHENEPGGLQEDEKQSRVASAHAGPIRGSLLARSFGNLTTPLSTP